MHRAMFRLTVLVLLGLAAATSSAGPAEIQKGLETGARAADPGFQGFSAERGERFFKARHGNDWTCASCHMDNPLSRGKHARTGKDIAPLAPAANPKRFSDVASVEKWFRRNCNDVLGRACSAAEKGDVMQYLLSLK